MRMTAMLAPTTREVPADAEIVSHQLLVRGGYVRRVAAGIYNFYPLMWRVLKKVSDIVREEMDRTGAQELMMPIVQPAELWQDSGRLNAYGKELLRLEDRHERLMVLGPTHEEMITSIARAELQSYRQLPANLYQIQTKFRDEIRPRFGLLRGREFIMKDAYSFHADTADLDREYEVMSGAYSRIFQRCGLTTRLVESDSGAIGGSTSHEFMVVVETDAGENLLLFCHHCDYAANVERADSLIEFPIGREEADQPAQVVATPGVKTIDALAGFLHMDPHHIVKTLLYVADERLVAAMLPGSEQINEVKLKNALAATDLRLASEAEVQAAAGVPTGFVGPQGLPREVRRIGDRLLQGIRNFTVGVNQEDAHLINANWGAEVTLPELADLRLARSGDSCPRCREGRLQQARGIEVGNIFKLGTKYSEAMQATFANAEGQSLPFVMGCYGIGVTRTAQAAVEACHDADGILWPVPIAPYHLVIVPVNTTVAEQVEVAERLYAEARQAGIEVVLDDREERAGVKFKDADLIGFPVRVTVGKTVQDGLVEVKSRAGDWRETLPVGEAIARIRAWLDQRLEFKA